MVFPKGIIFASEMFIVYHWMSFYSSSNDSTLLDESDSSRLFASFLLDLIFSDWLNL
jgi:hypothetical protein